MKKENEYETFDKTMQEILKVSHGEVKAKIEEEMAARKKKKAMGKQHHDH